MRTITVAATSRSYPIIIGPEARTQLPELIKQHGEAARIALICDERVAELHLSTLLESIPKLAALISVPPGEQSKSPARLAEIYDTLAEARISRGDLIIAFGGGVIGDLAGYSAATWMRGVSFIQLPTTLLAAIDASCGGKTGVNHPSGKNLIGAFHQPIAVVADVEFLATLSERDYRAGLAESVKHAAIRDETFLVWQEGHADRLTTRDGPLLAELIERNCRIKAEIVALDERESGPRMDLNHGHTIGHAIEHLLDYELRHGECVALGMIVENELARARDLLPRSQADRIAALLARLGLPVRLPRRLDGDRVAGAIQLDKKVRDGKTVFALLRAPGDVQRMNDVSSHEIDAALAIIQP